MDDTSLTTIQIIACLWAGFVLGMLFIRHLEWRERKKRTGREEETLLAELSRTKKAQEAQDVQARWAMRFR